MFLCKFLQISLLTPLWKSYTYVICVFKINLWAISVINFFYVSHCSSRLEPYVLSGIRINFLYSLVHRFHPFRGKNKKKTIWIIKIIPLTSLIAQPCMHLSVYTCTYVRVFDNCLVDPAKSIHLIPTFLFSSRNSSFIPFFCRPPSPNEQQNKTKKEKKSHCSFFCVYLVAQLHRGRLVSWTP